MKTKTVAFATFLLSTITILGVAQAGGSASSSPSSWGSFFTMTPTTPVYVPPTAPVVTPPTTPIYVAPTTPIVAPRVISAPPITAPVVVSSTPPAKTAPVAPPPVVPPVVAPPATYVAPSPKVEDFHLSKSPPMIVPPAVPPPAADPSMAKGSVAPPTILKTPTMPVGLSSTEVDLGPIGDLSVVMESLGPRRFVTYERDGAPRIRREIPSNVSPVAVQGTVFITPATPTTPSQVHCIDISGNESIIHPDGTTEVVESSLDTRVGPGMLDGRVGPGMLEERVGPGM